MDVLMRELEVKLSEVEYTLGRFGCGSETAFPKAQH